MISAFLAVYTQESERRKMLAICRVAKTHMIIGWQKTHTIIGWQKTHMMPYLRVPNLHL